MMYGDPQQQQNQQQQQQPYPGGGDFQRGGPPPQQQQQQLQPPMPPPPTIMRQPSASSTNMNPDFYPQQPHPHHHHHQQPPPGGLPPSYEAHGDSFAAKRMRKPTQRRAVDYTSTVVRYMQIRMWQCDSSDRTVLQPTPAAAIDMLPATAYSDNPSTSFAAKFVHTSLNKNRCSINRVLVGWMLISSALLHVNAFV